MVSLTMMARLLEAVRPDARGWSLVGDPDQLSSVEAGAVLADRRRRAPGRPDARLVRPPGGGRCSRTRAAGTGARRGRSSAAPGASAGDRRSGPGAVRDDDADAWPSCCGRLDRRAVRRGRPRGGHRPERRRPPRAGRRGPATGAATLAAARAGDVPAALGGARPAPAAVRHRRGPYGVGRWSREVERWLAEAVPGYAEDGEWYLGRPLLVTANDYELGLYNGDTGVIVDTPDGVRAAFARGGEATLFAPVRLDAIQTVHAMTVHRAQGSQFERVTFLRATADVAAADPRAALHRRDPGQGAGAGDRLRGRHPPRRPAAGQPRQRPAQPPASGRSRPAL